MLAIIAAAFVLLPSVLLELIYPQLGAAGRELTRAEMRALAPGFIAVGLIQVYGQLAMVAVATDNARSTVGAAMGRALAALPRVVLALLIFAVGIAALAFMLALILVIPTALVGQAQVQQASGLLMLLLIGPLVYASTRLSLVNTVAVTDQVGPAEALKRSWQMSKGQFLPLVGLIVPTVCALLIAQGLVGMVTGGTARALEAVLGGKQLLQFAASLITGTVSAAGTAYFSMLFVSIWQRLRTAAA